MKTTVFILSTVVAMFVFGCQDNTSLNPAADQQLSGSTTALAKPQPLILPLTGLFRDPMSLSGLSEVSGHLEVSITGQALLEVSMSAYADVKSNNVASDQASWTVSCRTTDWIKVLPGGSVTLEKSYGLAGRSDGATLRLSVMITRDGEGISRKVSITKLFLAVPKVIPAQAYKY